MQWVVTKAEVWLSSVDMAWERECDGVCQRLHLICEGDVMHGMASQWLGFEKRRVYSLGKIPRRMVISQEEITGLWNQVYFDGEED